MLVQELYFAVIRNRQDFLFPVKFFFLFVNKSYSLQYQGQSLIHVTFAVKDDITKYAFIDDIIFAITYEGAFLLYLASVSSEIKVYVAFSIYCFK